MEDSHHKDLQVNEKVARIYKPRFTVIPFFDLKESVFTSPAIILTSFADETEWFVTVIVIPSSPVITLIHNTTLFIFTIVVLTLFPILESGVNRITKDTSCNVEKLLWLCTCGAKRYKWLALSDSFVILRPLAPDVVTANHRLRSIQSYIFLWQLTVVSANHASSKSGLDNTCLPFLHQPRGTLVTHNQDFHHLLKHFTCSVSHQSRSTFVFLLCMSFLSIAYSLQLTCAVVL